MNSRGLRTILVLLAFVLAGCGNSADNTVFNPGPFLPAQPFTGKLFLGVDIPGVPISIETLDGAVIATQTTDQSGNYAFNASFPADFRVVATLDDGFRFSREVRGFGTQSTFGSITVPTTIVSRLAQAQPGVPLSTLEAQVRSGLGLAPGSRIAVLQESVNARFSHLAFFARAAQAGGLQNYVDQIFQTQSSDAPYLLRSSVLDADLTGLNPTIAGPLQALQGSPNLRLSTQRLLSRGLPDSAAGALGYRQTATGANVLAIRGQFGEVIAGIGAVVEDIGESLLEDVGDDVIDSIIDKLGGDTDSQQTWSAQQLEGHFGIAQDLAEISVQLTAIQDSLDAIVSALVNAAIQNDLAAANVFKDDIKSTQNSLTQAIDFAVDSNNYFSDTPSTLPQQVENIVNTLEANATLIALEQDVNGLQGLLTGSSGTPGSSLSILYQPITVNTASTGTPGVATPNLVLIQRDSVFSSLGITANADTARFGNFPVRSALILDSVLGPYDAYGQSQILGANLIAEAAHQSSDPGNDIPEAKAYADNVARSLQNTRAQIPDYPLSENYFIDLQNGLQWYNIAQANRDDAVSWAQTFDDGVTTGWRVPSSTELLTLLYRAGVAGGNGTHDASAACEGLTTLGFDISAIDQTTDMWAPVYYFEGSDWTDSGVTFINPTAVQGIGASGIPAEDGAPINGFFICRTIGETPVNDIVVPTEFGDGLTTGYVGNPGTWPSFFTGSPITDEIPTVGAFEGFSSDNVPNNIVEVTGEYTIYTGASSESGGYQMGGDTFTTTYDQAPLQYTDQPYTPPLYFITVDNAGTTVSNFANSFGKVINHINANVVSTINYHTLGYDGTNFPVEFSGSVPFNLNSPPQITMTQLQITPRNVALTVPGNTGNTTDTQQFLAVGFFDDQTVQDLTGTVTWSVIDTDMNGGAGGPPIGAVFSSSTPGLLELTNVANASENLSITATINQPGNPQIVGDDSTLVRVGH